LTGALGSAARLRAGGLEPVVVWQPEDLPRELRPRAAVVDMRTRDAEAGPRATAALWAERLRKMDTTRLELSINPTLEGAPAEELAGLLEGAALRDPVVIAVPAWPDAGRVCVDGVQEGVDVGPVLFGEPVDVVRPDELASCVRAGATRVVVDGSSDHDLRLAAVAVDALEADHTIVTASPGAWLRHHPVSARPRKGFALVVLGAGINGDLEDLDALVVGSEPPDWDEVAAGGKTVVLDVDQAAADAAVEVLARAHDLGLKCRGIVAAGGALASRLVDALGAQRLAVAAEVAPLCARGTLFGGDWAGLPVITRGSDCALGVLVDDLWRD
jgi:uncharacterized protein YgbK (DUF1537 family)